MHLKCMYQCIYITKDTQQLSLINSYLTVTYSAMYLCVSKYLIVEFIGKYRHSITLKNIEN